MDQLDAEIVRLLQADARQSNRELARALGVAPSTCLERVRSLTRRGVIEATQAAARPTSAGGRPATLYRYVARTLVVTNPFAAFRPPAARAQR